MKKNNFLFRLEIGKKTESNLKTWLDNSHHKFSQDITIIKDTNKIIPKLIKKNADEEIKASFKKRKWSKKDKEEYTRISKGFDLKKNDVLETKNPIVTEVLSTIITNFMHTMRIPMFVREMSLVYLVTSFEAFVEEVLQDVFRHDPRNLKSKKEISFEEILKCSDMDEIIEKLSKKEISLLLNEDIEKINKYLTQLFGIELDKRKNWAKFKELFYRRNLIIHNDARINTIYIRKTGYKGKDTRLTTDEKYIADAINMFQIYSKSIMTHIQRKYKNSLKKERVGENQEIGLLDLPSQ